MNSTKSQTVKHFFLNRQQKFEEVKIISQTAHKRRIKFADGREKTVHPEGVAWGQSYPRVFTSTQKPNHVFSYKGRAVAQMNFDELNYRIPHIDPSYRFQPFVSFVLDSINSMENVLLSGGTGTGKTTSIMQIAAHIKQPVTRINLNGETRLSDILGKMQVADGRTFFEYGVLPNAMKEGHWLILDELDFADPAVLAILHPVLEANPILVLKENAGEVINPHPNFRIFATANSVGAMGDRAEAYDGTNKLNDAFLDRWQVVYVPNLLEKEEVRMLRHRFPGLQANHAKNIVKFANAVREGSGELSGLTFGDNFSTRKVISWAKKTKLYRDPILAARISWLDKMPLSEQATVVRILGTFFGKRTRVAKKISVGGFTLGKVNVNNAQNNTAPVQGALATKRRGRPPKNAANQTPAKLAA